MDRQYAPNRAKKKKIQHKLAIFFLVFALILSLALSIFSYVTAFVNYTVFFTQKIQEIVSYAATQVNGDRIAKYLDTMEKDAYYEELQQQFNLLKKEHDLMYLFIFKPNPDDLTYILEAVKEGDDPAMIGELGEKDAYAEVSRDLFFADLAAREASEESILISDKYGFVSTAWAPVLDQQGEVAAFVQADLSMHKELDALNSFAVFLMISIIGVIFFSSMVLIFFVRKRIANPIIKLTETALNFASGDTLSFKEAPIKTGDELETLSDAFHTMAGDIESYVENIAKISAEKERIETELSVAKSIQMGLLPSIFPAFPERDDLDLYAFMEPAKEVGGDFYDFFLLDGERLGIVIADVSGKGIPAALFMMISKTLIKNYALEGMSASEILFRANNALCENNDAGMFVTAFLAIVDLNTGRMSYASAGHNPPLIQKKDGPFTWLPVKRSFVLAGMENTKYTTQETDLQKGDRLLLYTDGVTEAMNKSQELFSDKLLLETVNRIPGEMSAKEMLQTIKAEVDLFADGAEQADDITLLSVSRC